VVRHQVENQVVALRALGEILLRVINDPIGTEGADQVHILRAANAGHLGTQPLGDLHRERPHPSRRAVDQDLLPRLNLPLVTEALQRGVGRYRYGSRLLKGHVTRLENQRGFGSAHILGEGATARAEHGVARLELGYVPAHRFHLAGHIKARPCDLRLGESEQHANDVGHFHEVVVGWIEGSGADSYQNFIVLGSRLFDVLDLDNAAASALAANGGLHFGWAA
jgi:hypothetical protein